jgi:nucleoporin NDC1
MAVGASEHDVRFWRLVGVVAWHACICAITSAACSLLPWSWLGTSSFSVLSFMRAMFLYACQLCVLYAHRMTLSANHPPPLQFPALGIHSRSWISLFLTKIAFRHRRWSDFVSVMFLLGTTCGTGMTYLYSSATGVTLHSSFWDGILIGTIYTFTYLLRWVS